MACWSTPPQSENATTSRQAFTDRFRSFWTARPRRVGRAPLPVDVVHGNALPGRLAPRILNIGLEGRARPAERPVDAVVSNTEPATQF